MIELALNKLQKYYGATMVLEDITFEVMTRDRVGIVGDNGCGKTTLFKIIMGIEGYEKGMLTVRKGATLGYLEQVPNFPEGYRVMDVLQEAFKELLELEGSMKLLEKKLAAAEEEEAERILKSYSELQITFEGLGGYEREEKLSKVCTGLKIGEEFLDQEFHKLSGGEKTTVILGKILLESPDILLLDEPSNHLDLEALEWLEDYLKEYRGVVLLISHDRYFLDKVATKIVEIEDMVSTTYQGNYTAYVKEKERQLQLQLADYEDQQKKIKAMEKSIAQLRDWGQRGDNPKFFKKAASMQKMLDRMEKVQKPVFDRSSISINVNSGGRSGNEVIIIEALSKSYGSKNLLDKADLLIRQGEAVGLIGSNGSGKSTLIKILLGYEKEDSGLAELGSSTLLAYLPQNVTFDDNNKTVLDTFREDIVMTEGKAREYLARYMFYGEGVFKKLSGLSGGERSRLKLAMIMYHPVNLLILDEPTNHLDIASREELEELLKSFKGTILFVSHDRQFINNIATRVVELKDGKLISYEGDYEYYKEKSLELKAKSLEEVESSYNIATKEKDKIDKAPHNSNGSNRTLSGNSLWRKEKLEGEIEKKEDELKVIEEEIEAFFDDYERLNALYTDKKMAEDELEKLMEEYFSYS